MDDQKLSHKSSDFSDMDSGTGVDNDFEPTIDMIVNDFDDETTMDDAECFETAAQQQNEAALLAEEQHIPIERLLEMYGRYPVTAACSVSTGAGDSAARAETLQNPSPSSSQSSCAASESGDRVHPLSPCAVSNVAPRLRRHVSHNSRLTISTLSTTHHHHSPSGSQLSVAVTSGPSSHESGCGPSGGAMDYQGEASPSHSGHIIDTDAGAYYEVNEYGSDDGLDEEDEDCPLPAPSEGRQLMEISSGCLLNTSAMDPLNVSWRKTIMIGSAYQAQLPGKTAVLRDDRPYENSDQLVWRPDKVDEEVVHRYLGRVQQAKLQTASGTQSLPAGNHVRDHEQALFVLMDCGYDVEEALRRTQAVSYRTVSIFSQWTDDECLCFENGLHFYGKDFYTIQQQKLRTRSVGELVQFYYFWKKTERHDVFASKTKLEKRKYALNPGVTDYMERFIDEQEVEQAPAISGMCVTLNNSTHCVPAVCNVTSYDVISANTLTSGGSNYTNLTSGGSNTNNLTFGGSNANNLTSSGSSANNLASGGSSANNLTSGGSDVCATSLTSSGIFAVTSVSTVSTLPSTCLQHCLLTVPPLPPSDSLSSNQQNSDSTSISHICSLNSSLVAATPTLSSTVPSLPLSTAVSSAGYPRKPASDSISCIKVPSIVVPAASLNSTVDTLIPHSQSHRPLLQCPITSLRSHPLTTNAFV